MSHKANASFFDRKRPWSKRKDHILAYYLEPYLAKVARLERPILLVDGFAGPGKFDDGEIGSPLLLCAKAQKAISRGARVKVLCIESDSRLCERLKCNLTGFDFADALCGRFLDHAPYLSQCAASYTTFLYIDPWTVTGLDWSALDDVFRRIHDAGASVELLLNFNAAAFVRHGLAALRRQVPGVDPSSEDCDEIDDACASPPSTELLSRVIDGDQWRSILGGEASFSQQVRSIADALCARLRQRFAEVVRIAIKAHPDHLVPKYYLVFASRHPDALKLMNDAMAKSRGESIFFADMFSHADLERLILDLASSWVCRGELILNVMRRACSTFTYSEIRGCVEALLKASRLESVTGRSRINDSVCVRTKTTAVSGK